MIKCIALAALLALCAAMPAYAGASVQGSMVIITDGSGSVTTGATSQQIFAADTTPRVYLFVQNPNATLSGVAAESCFVNIGAAASSTGANSYELANNASLTFDGNAIPSQAVNITCPTTGHKFVAKYGR